MQRGFVRTWFATVFCLTALVAGAEAADTPDHAISGKVVTLEPLVLDGYIGTYQLKPGVFVVISREGAHLYAQITGQQKFELFAENETDFSSTAANAKASFTTDNTGRSTDIEIRQDGHELMGPRAAPQK